MSAKAIRALAAALLFGFSLTEAQATIPVTDAAREFQEGQAKKNTLDAIETKRGQSQSTEGVACNFRRSKQQAMSERGDVAKKIAPTCQRVGVEPALGLSIAYQESQFNQTCKAPTTPWSGGERATGVMQVLPSTAARVGKTYVGRPLDATNEDDNILAGCLYLKEGSKITSASEYHTITGYHNGYNSRVMRDNLPLPAGWKNGLKYGDLVQKRHLPYFRSVMGGSGDPGRFQWDQLQTNIYSASANGIEATQNAQATFANRLTEQAGQVGQAPTTLLAWDDNSRARLQEAQVQNNAIDAFSILMQLKMVALMAGNVDASESAKLLDYQAQLGPGGGTLLRDAVTDEIIRINADGSITRIRRDELQAAGISAAPAAGSPATSPPTVPAISPISADDVARRLSAIQSFAHN